MSFNLDDPLAGILSDGSDDSFFDDDVLGKKKPIRKKTTPNVERKNALFDLDNSIIKDKSNKSESKESTVTVSKPLTKSGGPETSLLDSHQNNSSFSMKYSEKDTSKNKIVDISDVKGLPFNEKLETKKSPYRGKTETRSEKNDFLDDLTGPRKEKNQPLEKMKDPKSLLDDILGKTSKEISQVNKPPNAKNQHHSSDKIKAKNETKDSMILNKPKDLPETLNAKDTKKFKPKEDWLGIFEDKDADIEADSADVPPWLGGSTSTKRKSIDKDNKSHKIKEVQNEAILAAATNNQEGVEAQETRVTENDSVVRQSENIPSEKNVFSAPDKIEAGDLTMQGATLYLQQQEAQLMVAMQLKAQDERLAAMQMKQKETQRVHREAALAQHAQLDDMLQRQAHHRVQMQAIINAHQDRIAQRIKALLDSNDTELDEVNEARKDYSEAKESEDNPRNKEKRQLIQLLQSLQENHDKEIDILETSYRRQLAFLEVSLSQTEERMRDESEKQIRFYTEKINWLEEHHQLFKKWTEENTAAVIARHNAEKEIIRQQHLENVKGIQEHHSALMENIKNAVKQEQVLIRDSAAFSTDIQELLSDVKECKLNCQQLVDRVAKMAIATENETERSMKVRETQINDMIEQLKKEREYFEKEKTDSKDMIHTLEARLKQMTTMMEEESASFKQKKMEFEFEKATFNKQTEFAKNVMKKQHEEVKMIKDDVQKEYEEKIMKLNEENAKVLKESALLAKDKVSIQNLKMELEKTKAELHAQLEEMSEERSKLNLQKNELNMEEQRILAKSREMDLLTKTALEKQTLAEKKCADADSQQRKCEERMRRLQEHALSLNTREKEIAREKIQLSRERISLHNERKKMEGQQKCSLCTSIPTAHMPSYQYTYGTPASRDYGDANVSHAVSNIELEMAQMMGRTFSSRHDVFNGVQSTFQQQDPLSTDARLDDASIDAGGLKDYMDPKFMMLRLDVQKVINNLGVKNATSNNEDRMTFNK